MNRKSLPTIAAFSIILMLSSCISGDYVSREVGASTVTQAPLKLKLNKKAQWTYYEVSSSAVYTYYENAKYRVSGDTLMMSCRAYYGDTSQLDETFIPRYIISGDSLISMDYDMAYIREYTAFQSWFKHLFDGKSPAEDDAADLNNLELNSFISQVEI